MLKPLSDRHLPAVQTALRVMAGLVYFSHGSGKLFGWFGTDPVDLMSKFGAAGVIETIAGACLILGLATHLMAFIASGEMAVAYFWVHTAGAGNIWWWRNSGEEGLLFAFIWLLFAVWGAGPYSLDAGLAKEAAGHQDDGG